MIRPIHLEHAETVARLIRTAFAAIETPLDPAPSALRVTAADIATHLHAGGGMLHGEAGCILWSEKDGGLYVGRLAVLPSHRNQGIAASLLAQAETEARRQGLPRIHLEVRLALTGNRRLFARAGFTETAQHAHPGYTHPTYVAAEKRLT